MREEKVEKVQKALGWAIILSETSHVFCCALPVIVSTLSLLSVIGVISAAPAVLTSFHEVMHDYEMPLIIFSAVILALGWGLHFISRKLDCHSTGCCDEPCEPKKDKTSRILKIATGLFLFNLIVYTAIHVPLERMSHQDHAEHHNHDEHDH